MSRSDDDLVPRGGGAFLAEVAARRCLCRCRRYVRDGERRKQSQ